MPGRCAVLVPLLVSTCCLWACSRPAGKPQSRGPSAPSHVILISLDTLRADRLGCYGYQRPTSPRLDALAAEGVVFTNVGAPSTQTLVSHKSLLAGCLPLSIVAATTGASMADLADVEDQRRFIEDVFANAGVAPLVDRLRAAGYYTAAFTDGRWMTRALHFDQGFDKFNDDGGHLAAILPRVRYWLKRFQGDRFFLFVHAYDTHCPYVCREPYNSLFCHDHSRHIDLADKCPKPDLLNMDLRPVDLEAINDHYDGGIASADAYVGNLLDLLKRHGLYDQALIVVTSDHGESLGEHGQIGHGGMYLEQLLVPLIVKFPRDWHVPPRRITAPVSLIDVMPTILAVCGVSWTPPPAVPEAGRGRSLLPLIRGSGGGRDVLVAQITYNEGREGISSLSKRAALLPGRWLLIEQRDTKLVELFDLRRAPQGIVPATAADELIVSRLRAALAECDAAGSGPFRPPAPARIDQRTRHRLEKLGYITP